jgi:hypothetical protein
MLMYMKSLEGKIPVDMHIETGPFKWGNVIDFELRQARRYPKDTLIFTDAYDFLFIGDPDRVSEIASRQSLLLQTTPSCWPHASKASEYEARLPGETSKWRYVSGCGGIGLGQEIAATIEWGLERFPIEEPVNGKHLWGQDNDQRFWTDLYLNGWGVLDTKCEMTQNLHGAKPGDLELRNGRLHNLLTDSWPQFIHASAATWSHIPRELLP